MNNKRKAPGSAGTLSKGVEQNTLYNNKSPRLSGQTKSDAKQVADVLIRLQQQFPDFFRDIKPDDPDLDLDRGFSIYESLRLNHES